jgi:hypothetical protein
MKFLILLLIFLFILPVFVMGESPPVVADALQIGELNTIAISVNQDAALVLYDIHAVPCVYDSLTFTDNFKMISLSVNAQKIDRAFGITSESVMIMDSSPDNYLSFVGEPELVLRL